MLQGFSFRKISTVPAGINVLQIAVFFALLMHVTGLTGIVFINKPLFTALTPLNLLLMPLMLIFFHTEKNRRLMVFFFICFSTGWLTEWIGINKGWLFGSYTYGRVLGYKIGGVPLLIGINWFMIVYCSAAWVISFFMFMEKKSIVKTNRLNKFQEMVLYIFFAASLTVIYDFVMEPVAIKLGFWYWLGDGSIPLLNYICWFGVSAFLLLVGHMLNINMSNRFAAYLFSIQLGFFFLLGLLL